MAEETFGTTAAEAQRDHAYAAHVLAERDSFRRALDAAEQQIATLAEALEQAINWHMAQRGNEPGESPLVDGWRLALAHARGAEDDHPTTRRWGGFEWRCRRCGHCWWSPYLVSSLGGG